MGDSGAADMNTAFNGTKGTLGVKVRTRGGGRGCARSWGDGRGRRAVTWTVPRGARGRAACGIARAGERARREGHRRPGAFGPLSGTPRAAPLTPRAPRPPAAAADGTRRRALRVRRPGSRRC